VREAFQSLIYLLLTITNIRVHNDIAETTGYEQMLAFRNQEGLICGSIPDLVWQEWLSGRIPEKLGIYQIDLEVPDGWFQVVNGKVAEVSGIEVDVQVTGHIVTITGPVRHLALVNASSQEIERSQIEAKFDMPPGTYPVTMVSTEEQLQKFINRAEGINLSIGRFRLPRIRFGPMYWPPSESTARKAISLMRAFANGKIPDPRPLDLAEIEGTDMQKLWEPIWKEHPSAKKSES